MVAIETRFIGPTNTKGSRIVVTTLEPQPRRAYVPCDDRLGIEENHKVAAMKLIRRLGWTKTEGYGDWIVGGTVRGYVFVCDSRHGYDRMTVEAA